MSGGGDGPRPLYARCAIPAPVRRLYTYRLPERLREAAEPGQRLLVPFGPRKLTGILVEVLPTPDLPDSEIREVADVLDAAPSVTAEVLRLSLWVADYYLASAGETLQGAIPPGLRRTGKKVFRLTARAREALSAGGGAETVREADRELLGWIGIHEPAPPGRIAAGTRAPGGLPALARLERDGWLESEVVVPGGDEVRAKTIVTVSLAGSALETAGRGGDLAPLAGRSKGRLRLLEALALAGVPVPRADLLRRTRATREALASLQGAGLVATGIEETLREPGVMPGKASERPVLSGDQERALGAVRSLLDAGGPQQLLLQGVTGSGKTEVYLRAIEETIGRGKSALMLVPEIGLTPAFFRMFRGRFGERVALLHSALGRGERYDEWRRVRDGKADVVLGARSAVFAPVRDLGLLVVDEEHDPSYKQGTAPRYSGRDAALVRAQQAGALAILGSATPSLESRTRAESGRTARVLLPERVRGALATVEIVDMAEEWRATRTESPFSRRLLEGLRTARGRGEQSILLLNRRGWQHFLLCRECGERIYCPHCSISLTVHRRGGELLCHYCGHRAPAPGACPGCGGEFLEGVGEGTQWIEEKIREEVPGLRVLRLDQDVVRRKGRPEEVLAAFERGEADLLLGTQMVSKGHDFPGVTLVGVLSADHALAFPDFRSSERTFQLLTQVAGRSGRGERPGTVLVQTYAPQNHAIRLAAGQDYEAFYAREIDVRRTYRWPPFWGLVLLLVKDRNRERAEEGARLLAQTLRARASRAYMTLGPAPAPIERIRDQYRFQVFLKSQDRAGMRHRLGEVLADLHKDLARRRLLKNLEVDVDPQSLL